MRGAIAYMIRQAQPDDAAAVVAYIKEIAGEPGINIPLTPAEFAYTPETEREFIQATLDSPYRLMLVALDDTGAIVGELSLNGSTRRALRHGVELGMTVRADWRGQGVGSALLARAIAWARAGGVITRIELHVYARNAPAIALYRKFGFVEEGRRRAAIYQAGEYLDDLIMALLVSES